MQAGLKRFKIAGSKTMVALFLAFALYACLDDFNRNPETIYYNPSFSLPVGPVFHTLHDIMPFTALHHPIPDISALPGTADVPILIYNDSLYFVNPREGHDTAFFEPFDILSLVRHPEYIVSVMVRANVFNGLPVNTALQVYYLDTGGIPSDSLYNEGTVWIPHAAVDDRDSVLAASFTTIDTYLDEEEIQNLIRASQFSLAIHLQTFDPERDTLRVYSYQHFDVQLAMRIELIIPVDADTR